MKPTTAKSYNREVLPFVSNAVLPMRIQLLRRKLSHKARNEKKYRFYSLYNHICMPDILEAAFQIVSRNNGSAGIDGISIQSIKASSDNLSLFLNNLHTKLVNKTYRAKPVKRVYIPKRNGKLRPLGIPTVEDRVVQTAIAIILIPIFEQDFKDCSYGFRPNRNAHQALRKIYEHLCCGRTQVFDADISGYFDNIPHNKLIKALQFRISDASVIKLIRMWLKCPIVEVSRNGKQKYVKSLKGSPQGGVISPLLANIYLHWFDVLLSKRKEAQNGNIALVRYADDFVVMCKKLNLTTERWIKHELIERFELSLNEEKTKILDVTQTSLCFLGYTFALHRDKFGGNVKYWHLEPSKDAIISEYEKLRNMTSSKCCHIPIKELVASVNKQVNGWVNYFKLGNPSRIFRKLEWFMLERIYHLLKRKSQRGFKFPEITSSYNFIHGQLGLSSIRRVRAKVV